MNLFIKLYLNLFLLEKSNICLCIHNIVFVTSYYEKCSLKNACSFLCSFYLTISFYFFWYVMAVYKLEEPIPSSVSTS